MIRRSVRIFAILVTTCVLFSLVATAQTNGTWTYTNQMANSTENPVAVLLQTGKVLVAGGDLGTLILPIRNAQLYDPATNNWSVTGKMTFLRAGHAGTLLPNGRVLIAGGTNGNVASNGYDLILLKTAEQYDPVTGKFSVTGNMSTARYFPSLTLLPSGKVLVAGGINLYKPRLRYAVATKSAEIFDPATGTWSPAGQMSVARAYHSAVVLPTGKVLVVGSGSADLYDPSTNSWTPTAAPLNKSTGSWAVLLQTGKVLAVSALGTAELYDPVSATWAATGSMLTVHTGGMVLLTSGKALIAGSGSLNGSCELYDPVSGTWSATGSLNSPRTGAPVTLLPDGKVLISGGSPIWWNGEVYTP